MSQNRKPVALAIGATLAGGLALSGSAFASTQLAEGYLLGAQDAAAPMEDKAKEGKCGIAEMDTDKDGKVSRSEFTAAHGDDAGKFDGIDTNQDGFIDAGEGKAHHEGSCGADRKADKAGMEGKCGEGKCGGAM